MFPDIDMKVLIRGNVAQQTIILLSHPFSSACSQMGYANLDQTAGGIHFRLYSRAFIVDDGSKRVVFVTADIGMVSQRLRLEVGQSFVQQERNTAWQFVSKHWKNRHVCDIKWIIFKPNSIPSSKKIIWWSKEYLLTYLYTTPIELLFISKPFQYRLNGLGCSFFSLLVLGVWSMEASIPY